MGIIFGNEKPVAPQAKPVEETPVKAVEEAVSEEQKTDEVVAPSDDAESAEEPKKPVRRARRRK